MNDVALDPIRSARFGEPVPTADERLRLKREGVEHIDVMGQLQVPVMRAYHDPTPKREGWEPRFVAINLDAVPPAPQKWVTYRRPKTDEHAR